jgi:hypothetical protein
VRKFVFANGLLNVGPEIVDGLDDAYDHEHLLRQLGEYGVGTPDQGYGVVDDGVARIDVDAEGLERALVDAGFSVTRAQLLRWDDGDESFDSPFEDE